MVDVMDCFSCDFGAQDHPHAGIHRNRGLQEVLSFFRFAKSNSDWHGTGESGDVDGGYGNYPSL